MSEQFQNSKELPATSDDVVSRARAALDGITPGPWVRDNPDDRFSEHDDVFSGSVWGRRVAGLITRRADAEFIAAAPDLVRDLLAENEQLRDDLRVERTVTHMCESVDADLREARAEMERLQQQPVELSASMLADAVKAEAERDEARAEVERLTEANAELVKRGLGAAEARDEARAAVDRVRKLCDDKTVGPLYEHVVRRALGEADRD